MYVKMLSNGGNGSHVHEHKGRLGSSIYNITQESIIRDVSSNQGKWQLPPKIALFLKKQKQQPTWRTCKRQLLPIHLYKHNCIQSCSMHMGPSRRSCDQSHCVRSCVLKLSWQTFWPTKAGLHHITVVGSIITQKNPSCMMSKHPSLQDRLML